MNEGVNKVKIEGVRLLADSEKESTRIQETRSQPEQVSAQLFQNELRLVTLMIERYSASRRRFGSAICHTRV